MAIVTPTEPPLPGAFCVASVAPVPRSQVASALSALDPRVTAVVEPETALGPREGLADQLQGLAAVSNTRAWPCATVQREATRIVAHARLDRPALLVVQSAFAGGWSARVDGRPWPLVRAYGSLAALPLDPGEHEVVLSYEAPGLAEGLWTTAVSAVGLLLLWLVPLWRGRKDGRNEEE
jgi:hypothetical protein